MTNWKNRGTKGREGREKEYWSIGILMIL